MAENAYLTRLNQLREQKIEANERRVAPILNRPMTRQAPGPVMGPGPQAPEEQGAEDQGPDMSTMFGRNLEQFMGQDNRFGEMFQEFTKLAEGLKEQVQQGYMPQPIAEQRLRAYIDDSRGYFTKNKPGLMDNPQFSQVVNGMLEKTMANQGQQQGGEQKPQQGGEQMPPEMMQQMQGGE